MIDQVIVALYLVVTLIVGLYVGRKTESIKDYAVGKRDFSTLILISAVFASVVDASGTIGLAGNTYSIGPIFLLSYLGIIFSRFTLAIFIAPKMGPFLGLISSGDIFEKLFGKKAKTLMGISTIIESTLMAGAQVLAISHLTQYFFHVSAEMAAIGSSLIIILYSFRGGIKSVTATDVFQFGILIIAIPIICGIGILEIGGYDAMISMVTSNGISFNSGNKIDFSRHLTVFVSFALPCLYPMCIQRMLMAKNTQQIKSAFLVNGILSIPFYIAVGLIGLAAFIILPGTDPNQVIPALVDKIVPFGLKGFVIAGLLAIFMSTADSILNIGAIAITHDFIGSLLTKPIKTDTELFLVRASSIAIALGAIIIAVRFNNVLDVIFLIMVVGNSVFFPGYLLGILGLHGSVKAFWIGVILGISTVIISISIFDLFLLNSMLLAITINASVHIMERFKNRKSIIKATQYIPLFDIKNLTKNFLKYSNINHVKNQDYCSIFAVCSIGISLFPFFNSMSPANNPAQSFFWVINGTTAILSFFVVFREIWWPIFANHFQAIWMVLLVISLPMQSIFMFLETGFSLVWLIDCLVILPLLSILTSRIGMIFNYTSGIILASIFFSILPSKVGEIINTSGELTVFIHIIVMAICLALFRKRDVEICRSTSSILIHEANRSLSTFEGAANFYETFLPKIISGYREFVPPEKIDVSTKDLEQILDLPVKLKQLSLCTKNALGKLFERVLFYSSRPEITEACNINDCIKSAINEPTFLSHRFAIELKEDNHLITVGDSDQITQVFINLIENAIQAIANTKEPKIKIVVSNQTITIEDNGRGISQANLPNIFDEYFSTKPKGGHGLFYCKQVISEHGGLISCVSQKNHFTKFNILMPQASLR